MWWLLLAGIAAAELPEGLLVAPSYTGEVWGASNGGLAHAGSANLELGADLDALAGVTGLSVLVHGVANHSTPPSSLLGDAQWSSNIEGPTGVALYEAWVAQRVGPVVVQTGVLELSRHFDVNEPALVFLHSSQSTGADLGLSGINGPSSFPNTGLGARVHVDGDEVWAAASVSDGLPGDPVRNDFAIRRGEGLLVLGEAGRRFDGAQLTVGAYGYTTQGFGGYAMIEGWLLREADEQGIVASARLGLADPRAQRFAGYSGASVAWTGAIDGRDADVVGLAVSTAWTGPSAWRAGARPCETAVELTWAFALTPWFLLQPDVQLVLWPDADPDKASGVLAAVRVVLAP